MREIKPVNNEQDILNQLNDEPLPRTNDGHPALTTHVSENGSPARTVQQPAVPESKKSKYTKFIILACILFVGVLIFIPFLIFAKSFDSCEKQFTKTENYAKELNAKLDTINGMSSRAVRDTGNYQSQRSCLSNVYVDISVSASLEPGKFNSETHGAEIVLQKLADAGLPQYSKTSVRTMSDKSLVYSTVNDEGTYSVSFSRNDEGQGYLGVKVRGDLLEPSYARGTKGISESYSKRQE